MVSFGSTPRAAILNPGTTDRAGCRVPALGVNYPGLDIPPPCGRLVGEVRVGTEFIRPNPDSRRRAMLRDTLRQSCYADLGN